MSVNDIIRKVLKDINDGLICNCKFCEEYRGICEKHGKFWMTKEDQLYFSALASFGQNKDLTDGTVGTFYGYPVVVSNPKK